MRKWLAWPLALAFLVLPLAAGGAFSAEPPRPAPPDDCCGEWDCYPARVRIQVRSPRGDLATVDGKPVRLGHGRARYSKDWEGYCYQRDKAECAGGVVSEECALCAVEREKFGQADTRVIPTSIAPGRGDYGRHLLLPIGRQCSECHR